MITQSYLVRLPKPLGHTLLYVPECYRSAVVRLLDNSGKLNWSAAYMVAQLPGTYWLHLK